MEIVWTGPTTSAVALRRTRLVLFDLIRSATSRITLVSYAAFRQDDLVEELRLAAGRGVRVRLVLESAAASRGRLDDDAARAFAALEGSVEVLEWPAELRGDGRAKGVLHAKAVVVDGRVALVSSANLTAAALDHNMELGLSRAGREHPATARGACCGTADQGDPATGRRRPTVAEERGTMSGSVLLAKGWEWDRAIPRADRDQILERVFRLPGWVDNQLGSDNLDVKQLKGTGSSIGCGGATTGSCSRSWARAR